MKILQFVAVIISGAILILLIIVFFTMMNNSSAPQINLNNIILVMGFIGIISAILSLRKEE